MKYLVTIFISLLIGCSVVTKNPDILYTQFTNYSKTTIDTINHTKYFSEILTKKINKENISQLSFSQYMLTEIEYFSKIRKNVGCLTINGLDKNNKPIVFYLKYDYIGNKWLISEVDVSFIENMSMYKKKALCPSDVRVE